MAIVIVNLHFSFDNCLALAGSPGGCAIPDPPLTPLRPLWSGCGGSLTPPRPPPQNFRCDLCMHVCIHLHVRMYAFMYVCMHISMHLHVRKPYCIHTHACKVSKTFILSISGPLDLLESIPRAISDRMVQVPLNLVTSRVTLGQNKVPRTFSTVFGGTVLGKKNFPCFSF